MVLTTGTPSDISSDPSGNFGYYFSSVTYNLGAAFGEAAGLGTFLKPNTTYYARVKVASGSGGAYNATLASTSTFAAAPEAPTFVNPSSYTVTANWTAIQDGPVLKYQAVISLNSDLSSPLATTAWQAGQSYAFGAGITPNTQYYVGVRALGNNGDVTALSVAGSTTTQYGPPGAPSFAAVSPVYLSTDSLVMQWTSGGNGGTPTYEADVSSTSDFLHGYVSVQTTNLQAAFGEAGLAASLKPNTTYYARVKVVSGSGSAYNATVASTSTFAVAPDIPTFVSPSSYTVTANWTASQDGPALKYQAVIAANPNFAPALATTTWQTGQSATFAAGITPNTQYYVGVRALGNNGDITALSVAGSTTTQYGPPGAPFFTAVSPVVLSTDSLVMQWASGGNGGSPQYQAD